MLEPKLFLRKNFDFYKKKYFYISHDNLITDSEKHENIDENKKLKLEKLLKANLSDINFYEHRFNINDILEEKDRYFDCEYINQQYSYFGYLILINNYNY